MIRKSMISAAMDSIVSAIVPSFCLMICIAFCLSAMAPKVAAQGLSSKGAAADGSSLSETGQGNRMALLGLWETDIIAAPEMPIISYKFSLEVTEENVDLRIDVYVNHFMFGNRHQMTSFVSGIKGFGEAADGGVEFDLSLEKVLEAYYTSSDVKDMNLEGYCGITDWAVGMERDITGLDCTLASDKKPNIMPSAGERRAMILVLDSSDPTVLFATDMGSEVYDAETINRKLPFYKVKLDF